MYELKVGRTGLLNAANFETGIDIVAGYVERDLKEIKEPLKVAFCTFMKKLRLDKGLDLSKLSETIDVSLDALHKLERERGFKPDPRTLLKLSEFYKIPMKALVDIIGVKRKSGSMAKHGLLDFALESESLEELSKEEKKLLKRFVDVLRTKYGN